MKRLTIGIAALFALGCDHFEHAHGGHVEEAHASGDHAHAEATASPTELPEGVNAVQNEMRLLHEAMRDSVTAVANDDLAAIPHALHRVHQARGLTESDIHDASYRPPRNPEQIEAFLAMDQAFHHELELLVGAAQSNDSAATGRQLGVVVSQCNGCHSQFRNMPAPPARGPAAEHHH